MKKIGLSPREAAFCRLYLKTRQAEEAALNAGYPALFARRKASALMNSPLIRDEIKRLKQQENAEGLRSKAAAGLIRAALGGVNDAVKLFSFEPAEFADKTAQLDLFCVSEIKLPKTGGLEIKFLDRVKALDALCRFSQAEDGSEADKSGFFAALSAAAASSDETDETDKDNE